MKRRLNDTASIVEKPLEGNECHSISTRKIDNGYLTCTNYYNSRTGESRSAEKFTPEAPRIKPPTSRGGNVSPDQGNPLRGCMDYMRDGE